MKVGDEVEVLNKIYIIQPNLVQILTEEQVCTGCAFEHNDRFSCVSMNCGSTYSPKDKQFIFVLKEETPQP